MSKLETNNNSGLSPPRPYTQPGTTSRIIPVGLSPYNGSTYIPSFLMTDVKQNQANRPLVKNSLTTDPLPPTWIQSVGYLLQQLIGLIFFLGALYQLMNTLFKPPKIATLSKPELAFAGALLFVTYLRMDWFEPRVPVDRVILPDPDNPTRPMEIELPFVRIDYGRKMIVIGRFTIPLTFYTAGTLAYILSIVVRPPTLRSFVLPYVAMMMFGAFLYTFIVIVALCIRFFFRRANRST